MRFVKSKGSNPFSLRANASSSSDATMQVEIGPTNFTVFVRTPDATAFTLNASCSIVNSSFGGSGSGGLGVTFQADTDNPIMFCAAAGTATEQAIATSPSGTTQQVGSSGTGEAVFESLGVELNAITERNGDTASIEATVAFRFVPAF